MNSSDSKSPALTRLLIASDHAGFSLKEKLKQARPSLPWVDLGTNDPSRVDYPDYAKRVATEISSAGDIGILVCGSGQGMAIAANRFDHIRAALCWDDEITKLSRQHNDSNVLCLGARFLSEENAVRLLDLFLSTPFEGGRHSDRIGKLGRAISTC